MRSLLVVGHDVVFIYARSREKLDHLARNLGVNARAGTPAEAAGDASRRALVLRGRRTLPSLRPVAQGPHELRDSAWPRSTDLAVGHTFSGAEELAKRAKGAWVVSAFHTAPSEVFFPAFEARGDGERPSLLYSGDD